MLISTDGSSPFTKAITPDVYTFSVSVYSLNKTCRQCSDWAHCPLGLSAKGNFLQFVSYWIHAADGCLILAILVWFGDLVGKIHTILTQLTVEWIQAVDNHHFCGDLRKPVFPRMANLMNDLLYGLNIRSHIGQVTFLATQDFDTLATRKFFYLDQTLVLMRTSHSEPHALAGTQLWVTGKTQIVHFTKGRNENLNMFLECWYSNSFSEDWQDTPSASSVNMSM